MPNQLHCDPSKCERMVEVLERSMVVPSKETPSHSIWLSNLDLFVPRVYTPTVYFYRPTGDSDFFSVEPLKAALAEALVPFYPLAGRLGVDGTGRFQIDCTAEGVLFVVARSGLTIDYFGDFSPSDEMRKMLVPAAESADPPCVFLMFQIKHLKNINRDKPISTFKAVAAHVWRSACKARSLHPTETTRLQITADARSRTRPPLHAGFLGNAVFRFSAVAAAGDISSNTLEFAADKIGEAAARLGDGYVRSLIDYLETLGDPRGLHLGKRALPRSDVVMISWLELPIYGADFGWGRPAFMGKASQSVPGVVHVLPAGGESGGVTVAVGLESENMAEFKRVFYEDLGV